MSQGYTGQARKHRPSISSTSASSITSGNMLITVTTDKVSSPLVTQQPVLSAPSPCEEDAGAAAAFPPRESGVTYSDASTPQRRPKGRERSSTFSVQEDAQPAQYQGNPRLSKLAFRYNPFQPQQSSFCFLNPAEIRPPEQAQQRRSIDQKHRDRKPELRRAASLSLISPLNPLAQLHGTQEKGVDDGWGKLISALPQDALSGNEERQVKLMDKFLIGKAEMPVEKLKKLPAELEFKRSICRVVQICSKDGQERNFVIEKLHVSENSSSSSNSSSNNNNNNNGDNGADDRTPPRFKKLVDLSKVEKARRCWDEAAQIFAILLVPKDSKNVVFMKVFPHRKTPDLLAIIEKMLYFLSVQKSLLG